MVTKTQILNSVNPYIESELSVYEIPEDTAYLAANLSESLSSYGIEVIDLTSEMLANLDQIKKWIGSNSKKVELLDYIRELVKKRTESLTSDQASKKRYEVEYATYEVLKRLFDEENIKVDEALLYEIFSGNVDYDYWTALLDPELFQLIVGDRIGSLKDSEILDVGAGSGNLLKQLISQGISPENMTAIDISPTSSLLSSNLGIPAATGRLQDFEIRGIDLIFLSYFIDRDLNQERTFREALLSLSSKGLIVLEGLLPALPVDPSGVSYTEGEGLVTRGVSVEEDSVLIVEKFYELASELDLKIEIQRMFTSFRLVYSRDGFELLPSYFLTIRRIL